MGLRENTEEVSLYRDKGRLTGSYQLDRRDSIWGLELWIISLQTSLPNVLSFIKILVAFADSLNIDRSEMGFLSPELESEKQIKVVSL